ncbi:restriction endonuclease subunit S [Niallia sp. Krafla_26]|uniref:restriction endonuclease subunit S n=1 Tax=Niallia sp. Krafla_26 TaxID=3064703 RepID=UPI003D178795
MKEFTVKQLFKITKGKKVEQISPENINKVRFIQIDDLRNNNNIKYCSNDEKYVYATKNDVIIAWDGANAGTIGYSLEGAIGSTLAVLKRRREDFSIAYVAKFLQSKSQFLRDNCTGATIPHISRQVLENIKIPLPSFETQEKIVDVLDKVQALVEKRKIQISSLTALTQSVFLEIFGDPVCNNKGWTTYKLEDICTKITDGTHDTPKRLSSGVMLITGKNIRPFQIDYSNLDYVSEDDHKIIYSRCNPEYGDILYTNIGVNLGTAVMNDILEEFSMKNVALLKINKGLVESRYLESLLNYVPMKNSIIETSSSGGAQKFLSLGKIKNVVLPIPPLETQLKYTKIVEEILQRKNLLEKNLINIEDLSNSLMQQAFKGVLFSN